MPERSKRLRIIAGPNGSGKSTIIDTLRQRFDCGVYINTDEIEKTLRNTHFINLTQFSIESSQQEFGRFINKATSQSLIKKAKESDIPIALSFDENIILSSDKTNSYEAALVGEFIKDQLLKNKLLFTFETVMSHPSKLDLMKQAIKVGYRVYLYFIATESVEINIERVAQRVLKKGHNVDEIKIRERYEKSLQLLSEAVPLTYRSFLFDNSTEDNPLTLVGEIYEGQELTILSDEIPNWVYNFALKPLGFI